MSAQLAPGMAEAMAEQARLQDIGPAEAASFWSEGAPEVPTEDLTIPGGAGQPQSARIYRGGDKGTLVHLYGGGWVGGSIEANAASTRTLAAECGWDILAISYRLAPAHPFPAAYDDTVAALRWLDAHGAAQGLRTDRIALGGVSAGANLALAAALEVPVAALLLIHGVFSDDFGTESCQRYASGFGFSLARLEEIFDLYDPGARHRDDPRLCPLKGDLSALPPALLIAAECDVLADDSRALAARAPLAELYVEPGVTHGYINRGRLVPAAKASLSRAANFLKDLSP